jgi:beta-RFAP synthase
VTSAVVTVAAPARLHLGFLDLEGGLGRRFGSVGLTVEGIAARLRIANADTTSVSGVAEVERVGVLLTRLSQVWTLPPVRVEILETISPHAGLGSGTQLGLALGVGLARLAGRRERPRDVAALLERGARSGIGIGAFESGGFLLDGGKGVADEPPPIVSRLDWPRSWRMLLIFDETHKGLSGSAERGAFAALPPFPAAVAAANCRLVLMQLLPGIAESDLSAAGQAIAELQRTVGDHFAPAQGGRFTSAAVAEVLAWLESEGVAGLGQSSWGPTGFAFLPDAATAERLAAAAERRFGHRTGLRFIVTSGRNRGADIELG